MSNSLLLCEIDHLQLERDHLLLHKLESLLKYFHIRLGNFSVYSGRNNRPLFTIVKETFLPSYYQNGIAALHTIELRIGESWSRRYHRR